MSEHQYQDLITIFEQCFAKKYNTRLVRGEAEPVYLVADNTIDHNRIVFAHGFFRSALHECAHWLVAGDERRKLEDYGYWYAADGRNASQQAEFERVEVLPQAIEWILTSACKHRFAVSVDNLNGEPTSPEPFKDAVFQRVLSLQAQGLSDRAEHFRYALASFYGGEQSLPKMTFDRSVL